MYMYIFVGTKGARFGKYGSASDRQCKDSVSNAQAHTLGIHPARAYSWGGADWYA